MSLSVVVGVAMLGKAINIQKLAIKALVNVEICLLILI